MEVKSYGNLDQALTEFDSFEIFHTDTTKETKICHDKICPLVLLGKILVLSTNVERPIINEV